MSCGVQAGSQYLSNKFRFKDLTKVFLLMCSFSFCGSCCQSRIGLQRKLLLQTGVI